MIVFSKLTVVPVTVVLTASTTSSLKSTVVALNVPPPKTVFSPGNPPWASVVRLTKAAVLPIAPLKVVTPPALTVSVRGVAGASLLIVFSKFTVVPLTVVSAASTTSSLKSTVVALNVPPPKTVFSPGNPPWASVVRLTKAAVLPIAPPKVVRPPALTVSARGVAGASLLIVFSKLTVVPVTVVLTASTTSSLKSTVVALNVPPPKTVFSPGNPPWASVVRLTKAAVLPIAPLKVVTPPALTVSVRGVAGASLLIVFSKFTVVPLTVVSAASTTSSLKSTVVALNVPPPKTVFSPGNPPWASVVGLTKTAVLPIAPPKAVAPPALTVSAGASPGRRC